MSWGAVYAKTYWGVPNNSIGWGKFYETISGAVQVLASSTNILVDTIKYLASKF